MQPGSQKRVNHQVGFIEGGVERGQILAEHFDGLARLFATSQMLGRSPLHGRAVCCEEDARRATTSAQEPGHGKPVAAIVALAAQHHGLQTSQAVPSRRNSCNHLCTRPLDEFGARNIRLGDGALIDRRHFSARYQFVQVQCSSLPGADQFAQPAWGLTGQRLARVLGQERVKADADPQGPSRQAAAEQPHPRSDAKAQGQACAQ